MDWLSVSQQFVAKLLYGLGLRLNEALKLRLVPRPYKIFKLKTRKGSAWHYPFKLLENAIANYKNNHISKIPKIEPATTWAGV